MNVMGPLMQYAARGLYLVGNFLRCMNTCSFVFEIIVPLDLLSDLSSYLTLHAGGLAPQDSKPEPLTGRLLRSTRKGTPAIYRKRLRSWCCRLMTGNLEILEIGNKEC